MKAYSLLFAIFLALSSNPSHAQMKQSMMIVPGALHSLFFKLIGRSDNPLLRYRFDQEKIESELITYLHLRSDLMTPNIDSTFSFVNTKESLANSYVRDLGICRGISALRRKFRHLAFFDAQNLSNLAIPQLDETKKSERQFIRFYRNLVRDIRRGEPTIIPGFENLQEMSQHLLLRGMLEKQALYEWKNKNFMLGNGSMRMMGTYVKRMSAKKVKRFIERLKLHQSLGLNAMVWIRGKKFGWIHALEAIGIEELADSSHKVIMWNDKGIESKGVYAYLYIDQKFKMSYDDEIDEVRDILAGDITNENDGELIYMAMQVRDFCQTNPVFCTK